MEGPAMTRYALMLFCGVSVIGYIVLAICTEKVLIHAARQSCKNANPDLCELLVVAAFKLDSEQKTKYIVIASIAALIQLGGLISAYLQTFQYWPVACFAVVHFGYNIYELSEYHGIDTVFWSSLVINIIITLLAIALTIFPFLKRDNA